MRFDFSIIIYSLIQGIKYLNASYATIFHDREKCPIFINFLITKRN